MEVEMIYGPPGTGKTTELKRIVKEELKRCTPNQIALSTFTKEGIAQIMRSLVADDFNEKYFPFCRTLHSLAFRLLSLNAGNTLSKADYKKIAEAVNKHFLGYYTEDLQHTDDRYLHLYHLYRNNPNAAERFVLDVDQFEYEMTVEGYNKYKQQFGKFDYTDMLEWAIKEEVIAPVKVAFIDEAQDLTTLQWRFVWSVFRNVERLYIAGDDDQAIYEWSGADVYAFNRTQGKIRVLSHSYRLPDNILAFAKTITGKIQYRVKKEYEGIGKNGKIEYIPEIDAMPNMDEMESWLLLARNNSKLRQYRDWLMERGILFVDKGEMSIPQKDLLYVEAYNNKREGKYVEERLASDLDFFLGLKCRYTLPWELVFPWESEYKFYVKKFLERKKPYETSIRIGTIHSVKGSEATNVVVMSDVNREPFLNLRKNADSEHRVFYVAVTRAKENLYIIQSNSKYSYNLEGANAVS